MKSSLLDPHVSGHPDPEFSLQDSVVYGPIHSRRLGSSLGINPLPVSYKFCDFDCVYCQYGWTPEKGTGEKIKRAPELLAEIEAAFKHHTEIKTPVDCLTIAGNGEPTLHPDFETLVKGFLELRNRFYPKVAVGILSNASQVHRPEIREVLEMLDEKYMKLDAGDGAVHQQIDKPRGDFDFERMVNGLRMMRKIVIQSLFVQGSFDNTKGEMIDHWIETVGFIQPKEIQVYTISRKPADSGLREVSQDKLKEIAQSCHSMTGVPTHVFE